MNFAHSRRPDPAIDITPMIDVVFQLVLFFMVTTTFVNTPGIQVDLPRSSAQQIIAEKEDLNIWMTLEGAIFVDEEPVTAAQLRAILERTAERDPNTLVIIKADTGVNHGRVVTVMDQARSKGLARLAIATEASNDETP